MSMKWINKTITIIINRHITIIIIDCWIAAANNNSDTLDANINKKHNNDNITFI